MGPWPLLVFLTALCAASTGAEDATSEPEQETFENSNIEEGETKGMREIITPITVFSEKDLYQQAKEELYRAEELWKKGQHEAASDTALEAYDDFSEVWVPKLEKPKRRQMKHRAATVYIDAGIAAIGDFVQKAGSTPGAVAEGRSRLGDLWDVARNYPELAKKLRQAIDAYTIRMSSPTAF